MSSRKRKNTTAPKGAKNQTEFRFQLDDVEIRDAADGEGEGRTLVGYAALFDERSQNLGGFVEQIERGAFRKASGDDVRLLLNHDPNLLLGRTASGTLRLIEDAKGLRVEADLPNTQTANDVIELMKRGDLNQMSFGFIVDDAEWIEEEYDDGSTLTLRIIKSFRKLFDVSIVTFPAYLDTTAAVRSVIHGHEIITADGDICVEQLRAVSVAIHSGEIEVSDEERSAIDAAYTKTETVSPWTMERSIRAYAQEPDAFEAIVPGHQVTVTLEELPSGEEVAVRQLAALSAHLDLLALSAPPASR